MRADLAVFAKEFPEAVLIVEIKDRELVGQERASVAEGLANYMWRANCHYGLIMTPSKTYVLRDTFSTSGPDSIRITNTVSTDALLAGRARSPVSISAITGRELEFLAREWLERLTTSYEEALPDDPEVTRAFFPDIVGAVAEGRVVAEAAV